MITTLVVLGLLGCPAVETPPATSCARPARPAAVPVAGDPNGDGVSDIADGAAVLGSLFRGGPPLACEAAADNNQDTTLDAGDGVGLWYHLFAGSTALAPLVTGTCTKPEPADSACGDGVALTVSAPSNAEVRVLLTTGALDVEAVSVSLATDGCSLGSATFDGTAAADRATTGDGSRDGGFARIDRVSGGVVAAVSFDLTGDAVLPAKTESAAILALTVDAPGGSACAPCTLTLRDGLVGGGEPVANVVSAGGRAYVPELGSATIQVCPE